MTDLFDEVESLKTKEVGAAIQSAGGDLFDEIEMLQTPQQQQPEQESKQPEQERALVRGRGIAGQQAQSKRDQVLSRLDPTMRELVEGISGPEAALIGAGRGLTTIGRGLGLVDPETKFEKESAEALSAASPFAFGAGEIAGEAAPFLPLGVGAAGLTSKLGATAATAATGALEGGIITKGKGGNLAETITGAGIGGVVAGTLELALPVVGRLGGKLIRKVTGKKPVSSIIDTAGNPTPEFQSALDELNLNFDDVVEEASKEVGQVNPQQAARKSFLESQGIAPTKAQVTRDAGDFQAQQEAVKSSNKVRQAIEGQEAILSTRFDNVVRGSGGDTSTATNTVVDSVVDKATVLDKQISDLYKQARERTPGGKNVRFDKLASKLRELAPSDRRTGGSIGAVVGDLQAKGVLDENMKVVGRVGIDTAEDVRKLTNELFDPQNGFGNSKLRELKEALDDDVFLSAGEDVFKQARKAKADFEKDLTRAKISKFDSRKANLVRDILENKINPDEFTKDVIFSKKWRADDLQQLKQYSATDEAGKQAFNDLRADTLQEIKSRAFFGPEDSEGFKALSRDKLEKAIKSIGPAKINVLFNAKERKFLDDMIKVSKLREPVRGTALGEGPSAQAVNKLRAEIRKGSILANLADSITFDSKGKAILKAAPARIEKDITPSPFRQPVALGAAAAAQEE